MIHAIKLAMTASIKVASRALDSSSFIWRQNDFILFTFDLEVGTFATSLAVGSIFHTNGKSGNRSGTNANPLDCIGEEISRCSRSAF